MLPIRQCSAALFASEWDEWGYEQLDCCVPVRCRSAPIGVEHASCLTIRLTRTHTQPCCAVLRKLCVHRSFAPLAFAGAFVNFSEEELDMVSSYLTTGRVLATFLLALYVSLVVNRWCVWCFTGHGVLVSDHGPRACDVLIGTVRQSGC